MVFLNCPMVFLWFCWWNHPCPIVLPWFSYSCPMVFPMEFIPYFPMFRGRRGTTTWNAHARGPPACCARAPPPSTRPLQCIPGTGSVGFIIHISSIYSPYKFHPLNIYIYIYVGEPMKKTTSGNGKHTTYKTCDVGWGMIFGSYRFVWKGTPQVVYEQFPIKIEKHRHTLGYHHSQTIPYGGFHTWGSANKWLV